MRLKLIAIAAGLVLTASLSWAQRVRVVHASPDAPNVDILVDGARALENIPFTEYTDYVTLPTGQRNLAVFVAGTDTQVLEANLFIQNGVDYTILATGFAGGGAPALDLLVLRDRAGTTAPGSAKVRVVHAAPSAPAVDVYLTSPFLALGSQIPVLASVPFGAASSYLPVLTGSVNRQYQARVTLAGTTTVAIDSGRIVLPSEAVRTYVAVEMMGDTGPVFKIIELRDRN